MYAKIHKKDNILDSYINEVDDNSFFFYVEVDNKIEKNCIYDIVTITPNTPLTDIQMGYLDGEEFKIENPCIIDKQNCTVEHKYTAEQGAEINILITNYEIDKVTRRQIKNWCKIQPEGCEEAFLNLEHDEERYIAYKNKKKEIIAENKAKKTLTETTMTYEDIAHMLK